MFQSIGIPKIISGLLSLLSWKQCVGGTARLSAATMCAYWHERARRGCYTEGVEDCGTASILIELGMTVAREETSLS
ncbi:Uncharacterised protein [Pandoraea pnomenusa]|uniref:Uncharacterized protein n=1 Tax=Pandoraea pnomenusa TaxID=93220 RepID=A0A378YXU2_9BURK|nr:Uncharacterised protein [Pandoraea pnomenusa]